MLTIDPKEIPSKKMHSYLLGAVVPRPIAFASTINSEGQVNLSPFSFFNCFGSNPPTLVFSPSRRVRDNTTKHTLRNVQAVPEVVIHMVSYAMVEQVSLASCEYPDGVNEFVKAGFTEVASGRVRPPRVAEAPVAMECAVKKIIELGQQGGAGNLIICEVVLMHVREEILDDHGGIDPVKLDAVARMGGDNYLRTLPSGVFTVPKPNDKLGIGFDQLPPHVLNSSVLTGNDLGRLANIEKLPSQEEVNLFKQNREMALALDQGRSALHLLAQHYLKDGRMLDAWKVLLME